MKKKHPPCHPLEVAKKMKRETRVSSIEEHVPFCREKVLGTDEGEKPEGWTEHVDFAIWALYVMGMWLENKQVYRIRPEIARDILDTGLEGVSLMALHMPFPCIYIDAEDLGLTEEDADNPNQTDAVLGWFVCFEPDEGERALHCNIMGILQPPDGGYIYVQNAAMIGDITDDISLEYLCREVQERRGSNKHVHLRNALLLAAYLSSAKPDITEDPKQAKIYRPTRDPMRYASVRKWDVGVRYMQEQRRRAQAVQSNAEETAQDDAGKHAQLRQRPRPHMRRAHWHTYWAGKGRTQMRVLWIPPIAVGIHDTDEDIKLPAVVRTVV